VGNLLVVAVMVALTLDISINVSFNPTRSIIADVTPEGEARTRGYTWMQTISGFWGVMAYLVGAFIDNYALISVGVVLVLVFSVLVFVVEEPRELVSAERAQATATEWGQLWRIFVAHGFTWLGVQSMFVYIIAFIQQHIVPAGAADAATRSGQVIAISFAVMNVVGFILPALVLAPLVTRYGRVRVHALCVGVMAAAYLAIAFVARTPAVLYLLMAVVGVGWSAVVSLPFAIMSEKVDKSRMGFFMGLFNLSVVLPQLASTLVGFMLAASADKSSLFYICAGCLGISSLLWNAVSDKKNITSPAAQPVAAH
jgi:Na+/melibiose symporter-like transporter